MNNDKWNLYLLKKKKKKNLKKKKKKKKKKKSKKKKKKKKNAKWMQKGIWDYLIIPLILMYIEVNG